MSEKIRIQCAKCEGYFSEQARKIRGGAKIPCPKCKKVIAFENESTDENVRRALSAARKARLSASAQ
jgi:phage FluMu protein Com